MISFNFIILVANMSPTGKLVSLSAYFTQFLHILLGILCIRKYMCKLCEGLKDTLIFV